MAETEDAVGAERILRIAFAGYHGNLAVRLWNGTRLLFGHEPVHATIVFKRSRPLRDLILFRDPLRLAREYAQGTVDVEGDIYAVLGLKHHFTTLALKGREKASLLYDALGLRDPPADAAVANVRAWRSPIPSWFSKSKNRRAIAFHYDVSNDFYRLWLDEQMIYSCAYFEHESESLEQAQCNKLDHICRKLRLQDGDRLLDIGCGWGALILWAARHYEVRAHGITLSRNQYLYGQELIRKEGLEKQVALELKDYRELQGEATYDKIASVGMFEHVGLKSLPRYFDLAHRLLKPGGLFLNHGITHDADGWRATAATRFMNRYVFPDGELDRVANVQRVMEHAHFEILDVEALRPHYALTLRHWVERLETNRDEALRHVDDAVYRIWRLYMAACAIAFEQGHVGVYQILASKRGAAPPVPLTRRDLYDTAVPNASPESLRR